MLIDNMGQMGLALIQACVCVCVCGIIMQIYREATHRFSNIYWTNNIAYICIISIDGKPYAAANKQIFITILSQHQVSINKSSPPSSVTMGHS